MMSSRFQHTAARRRLVLLFLAFVLLLAVSTHSRPKAAGKAGNKHLLLIEVSTHSRPKAAGKMASWATLVTIVSTHSRPKAAGPLRSS